MFSRLVLVCTLGIAIAGCASKKTKEGPLPESAVSNEAMNFDPQGSDSGKIDGLRTIHFQFNKAVLDSNERDTLVKNAQWIKAHGLGIQIEGHCDLKGSTEYNLALGERRANVAKDYLVSLGVKADQISVLSYGKEKPLTTDDSDEAQAKNRRDNFVPVKK